MVFSASSHPFVHGQALVATANVGGTSYGVAYDSGKGEVFVTHFFNDSVSVLSDTNNNVVATVQFGQNYEPTGLTYDSGKGEIFVANYGANTVSVISDQTNKVLLNVSVGAYPYVAAYDSGKSEVFVGSGTSRTASSVSVISDATNTVVATVPVGDYPAGIAYDSAKGEVFVTGYEANSVTVISDSNNSVVATINVGTGPSGVAYDSAKGEVFVANYGDNSVSVISDTTNSVVHTIAGTLALGPLGPRDIVYDSAKGELFVANAGNESVTTTSVSVISDTTDSVTTAVNTGVSDTFLAYDPAKGEIFVGGDGDFIVSVISDSAEAVSYSSQSTSSTSASAVTSTSSCFSSGSIGAQLSVSCTSFTYDTGTAQGGPGVVGVGLDPIGLVYDSAKSEVYVTEFSAPAVAAISDASNSIVATVEIPGLNNAGFQSSPSPQYVAYDSAKGEIFASNLYGNCLTVISDATNTVLATIDLGNQSMNNGIGGYPVELAYDSGKGEIFVVNQGQSTIVGQYDASAGFVSVISDTTNSVVATIPLGDFPSAIAYDPAKGEMFVAEDGATPSNVSASNTAHGVISIISDSSNSIVATVNVGPFPGGVAYDPAKGEMFVSSSGSTTVSGSVSIISDSSNSIVATVPLADAGALAYDSAKGEFFVVTPSSNSTEIISDATNSVVGIKAAGPAPFAIVYDSAKSEFFVSNPSPADTVTVISDSSPTSTTTSTTTKSSSLALDPSYLAIVAVNVAVFAVLGALVAKGRYARNPSVGRGGMSMQPYESL
ncbi:MAG: YncE family protein [Thaumarchaeota archaeon]|nr:YncE family protein [Nitrososphaerota archaeon]